MTARFIDLVRLIIYLHFMNFGLVLITSKHILVLIILPWLYRHTHIYIYRGLCINYMVILRITCYNDDQYRVQAWSLLAIRYTEIGGAEKSSYYVTSMKVHRLLRHSRGGHYRVYAGNRITWPSVAKMPTAANDLGDLWLMRSHKRTQRHVHALIYIRRHIRIHTHIYIHLHTHTYIHKYIHTHIYIQCMSYIYIPTHTYIHIWIHICVITYINKYIYKYIHTHIYIQCMSCVVIPTHTYIHIWIHMHTYTYVYTHIY